MTDPDYTRAICMLSGVSIGGDWVASREQERGWWMLPWGFAFGGAAFFGWVLSLILPAISTFSSAIIAITIATSAFVYSGTALHLYLSRPSADLVRPKVLFFKKEAPGIFLISPASWLSYGFGYSLFLAQKDGFERFLGIAEVFNIQDDRKVQLSVIHRAEGADDIWTSLTSGSADHFKEIIIKPGTPRIGLDRP
ncbi:hypothetical protein [Mesorhizobium sp. B3-1-9]|uniref:hypothetical protein n=1 Tax=Mesorhizobium sp. B3-1-9 TaxID=2589892 RepID=UPI00112939CB|nr:hypothetical protein [Mesorhizobium sp. B3-1-9]